MFGFVAVVFVRDFVELIAEKQRKKFCHKTIWSLLSVVLEDLYTLFTKLNQWKKAQETFTKGTVSWFFRSRSSSTA